MLLIINPALMSMPLPYVCLKATMLYTCADIIFQILLPYSRPMTSHYVTCHVTTVSHASSSSKRITETRKENQYKIRKIKEKKNKIVSVQASHNKKYIK